MLVILVNIVEQHLKNYQNLPLFSFTPIQIWPSNKQNVWKFN